MMIDGDPTKPVGEVVLALSNLEIIHRRKKRTRVGFIPEEVPFKKMTERAREARATA